ncbi:MAG: hypothetical protein JWO00_660 [Candidatus Parcubacteria bacterium]|nr:hypothetical protein [Candidatus Parcubacteria bacterium]
MNILIASPDAVFRNNAYRTFRDTDNEVSLMCRMSEALKMLSVQREEYDVVVLDIREPITQPYEFLFLYVFDGRVTNPRLVLIEPRNVFSMEMLRKSVLQPDQLVPA